jgi:hypothetical protein
LETEKKKKKKKKKEELCHVHFDVNPSIHPSSFPLDLPSNNAPNAYVPSSNPASDLSVLTNNPPSPLPLLSLSLSLFGAGFCCDKIEAAIVLYEGSSQALLLRDRDRDTQIQRQTHKAPGDGVEVGEAAKQCVPPHSDRRRGAQVWEISTFGLLCMLCGVYLSAM